MLHCVFYRDSEDIYPLKFRSQAGMIEYLKLVYYQRIEHDAALEMTRDVLLQPEPFSPMRQPFL